MTSTAATHPDAIVVGGGVIGLAIAWQAARRGLSVLVADPAPGRGATHYAAGMLAPVTEAHYGEDALIALNLASARMWPGFAASLEEDSGMPVGYLPCGTLAVAADAGDRAVLAELHRFHRKLGLHAEMLTSAECRDLEPLLSPTVRGGLLAAGDHQVDNRALHGALLGALRRLGVPVVRERASSVVVSEGRVSGVQLASAERIEAGAVVLAAGCWSGQIGGLPPGVLPPVRPVKGHILRLAPGHATTPGRPLLARNLRGLVHGNGVYLVPRADGRLVVGATVEEQGFDTTVLAGPVSRLLRDARELLPAIDEMALAETSAGLRPGSPDNAPLLGPADAEGLLVATGHYRNGILLAPVTAAALAGVLTGEGLPPQVAPFSPGRFATGARRLAG